MKERITVRAAEKKDLSAMLDLINELATYEKASDAVIVDLETFKKYFSENRFSAIIAKDGDKLIGMGLYYEAYSTWKGKIVYLDDLVVTHEHRRKGVGEMLFDALIRKTVELDCKQMRWHVLDWNQPAINFYKKYRADLDPEWITGKLEQKQLVELSKKLEEK